VWALSADATVTVMRISSGHAWVGLAGWASGLIQRWAVLLKWAGLCNIFSNFSNYSNTLQGTNFEIRNQNLPEVQNFPNMLW
jgi:hypothetical protein